MRPIDADALIAQVSRKKSGVADKRYTEGFNDAIMRFRSMIHSSSTLDVTPVVHAKWEDASMDYQCSACKTVFHDDMFWITGDCIEPKYCPICGAKMDQGN